MSQQLEHLLEQAAHEPAWRPAFFQQLLAADAWVPGRSSDEQMDDTTPLDLEHWQQADGQSVIPFFTSQQKLAEVTASDQPWVQLPVRALFTMTRGETLFLNPKCSQGKAFTPAEIEALLRHNGEALSEQQVVAGQERLLLSQVVAPPEQLISSLTTLFTQYKNVRRAFLAHVRDPDQAEANLLIGIEAEGDIEQMIQLAGSVAVDTLPEDALIDLCEVVDNQLGVSHFFTAHIIPFYERRWGSFLRDLQAEQRII